MINKKVKEVSSGEKFSFEQTEKILFKEGGKNFTYFIFGSFVITHIDLKYSQTILNKNNWDNSLNKIKRKGEEDIISNYFSGIKFCETPREQNKNSFGCKNDDDDDELIVSKFIDY